MHDFIVNHAVENVWCTPDQDRQYIVEAAKVTPFGGARIKYNLGWTTIYFPEKTTNFHLFQIGQLHPRFLGLFPSVQKWMKVSDNCAQETMIVDIYTNSGIQYPRTNVWYMVTEDRNVLFAVKEQSTIPVNFNTETVYIRVYTNAYFESVRSNAVEQAVKVSGKRILSTQEILDVQNDFEQYQTFAGHVYAFVNGFYTTKVDLFTVKVGDYVEVILDTSISKVIDFPVKDLQSFTSILDNQRKFLLHYDSPETDRIDYQDDIDVFIYKPGINGRHTGVYYHKNREDALRMVTHRDYSIVVPYLVGYADKRPDWTDINELVVRLHIRESGYDRKLVFDDFRIQELYKLKDADVKAALLGLHSTVPNWRADALENCAYTHVMRHRSPELGRDLVQRAYGYNAMSKIVGDTPTKVTLFGGVKSVVVPRGLYENSTAYEYDRDGLMTGWYHHPIGTIYPTRNASTDLVEMISGTVGTELDEIFGSQVQSIDPHLNYRMYRCPKRFGQPTYVWEDVTDSSHYVVQGNTLTWLLDDAEFLTLVRSDRVSLGYSLSLPMQDGLLTFTINNFRREVLPGGLRPMDVPMGELDLFLNKRSLIENLDYYVQFPKVVIVNKEYLIDPMNAEQRIDLRFSGLCKKDLSREVLEDVGFVKYELLSKNTKFDLRDDRVMRMIVDGKLYHRSELKFAENDPAVIVPNEKNGAPYLIRDIVVPMRNLTDGDTYSKRDASRVIDKRVSDYLTMKLPEPVVPNPNVIIARYAVFSPFFCKILYDLIDGIISMDDIKDHYGDELVQRLCEPYQYLLAFDPTQTAIAPDDGYVIVHPHYHDKVVDVDIYIYKFLVRVIALYMQDRVTISPFLRIKAIPL